MKAKWIALLALLALNADARLPTHVPLVHDELRSAEGVRIRWNYSLFDRASSSGCTSCNSIRYASPLVLSLSGVSDSAQIIKAQLRAQGQIVNVELRKNPETGEWSELFPYTAIADYGVRGEFIYDLELTITIDEERLIEPLSQSNDFKFRLDR